MDFDLIGINGRDRRVYEALLNLPSSSVRSVAEQTGINRGSVYESIKSLVSLGLVTHVEVGKQTRFSARDPELLHEIINDRRRALSDMHSAVDKYARHLAIELFDEGVFPYASYYDGQEGVANILRDVLHTCRTERLQSYSVISSVKISTFLYENFPHFTKSRIKQGVKVRVLRFSKPVRETNDLAHSRYLPGSTDPHCYTLIYGDKVAFIHIGTYNHLSGVILENPGIASVQRAMFDSAWGQADSKSPHELRPIPRARRE